MTNKCHHKRESASVVGDLLALFPFLLRNSCVKKQRQSFKVFSNKKFVAETFTKLAALTLAKHNFDEHTKIYVCKLDKNIEKHYNDCVFYKHSIKKTKDKWKEDLLETRLDISSAKIDNAVEELVNIFTKN